jgi:hypothetical protein
MPKRLSVKTISSEEVQGEDSHIVIVSPKMGEMDNHRKALKPIHAKLEKLKKAGDTKSPEYLELSEKLESSGRELIVRFVRSWNWVDDDENPLPQPKEDGALGLLTIQELKWLSNQFTVSVSEKKG